MELVKYETNEHALCEILSREKKMEQRRRDQELHAHKNIWTKEPHGGRYINVVQTLSLVIQYFVIMQ